MTTRKVVVKFVIQLISPLATAVALVFGGFTTGQTIGVFAVALVSNVFGYVEGNIWGKR